MGRTGSKQSAAHNVWIQRGVFPSGVEDLDAVKTLADIGSSVSDLFMKLTVQQLRPTLPEPSCQRH